MSDQEHLGASPEKPPASAKAALSSPSRLASKTKQSTLSFGKQKSSSSTSSSASKPAESNPNPPAAAAPSKAASTTQSSSSSKSTKTEMPKPKLVTETSTKRASASESRAAPTSPFKASSSFHSREKQDSTNTVALELGSYFVEHHTHVFAQCILVFDDSLRRELLTDAQAAAAKRAEMKRKGVPIRITKKLKDDHVILIIKYRMHVPYSALLCIALALIIGCHPQLVSQQWVRGHYKTSGGRSLPIDEQATREELILMFETLHLTLKELPKNIQPFLGPTLKELLESANNHPTVDGLYTDLLALHRLLRCNPVGVSAVDFDTLFRLIASPYLSLKITEEERLIRSPLVPQGQVDAAAGWSDEQLSLDATFTQLIDASLGKNRTRWDSEVTTSASLFIEKALGARSAALNSSTIITGNMLGEGDDVAEAELALEHDLERLDAYMAEPLSDPENEDAVDEDRNNAAYLNWLLNGEEQFTRLEDEFTVDVIWDLEKPEAEVAAMDLSGADRVYTHEDSPLWVLKDIPIPAFLVPLIVGAEECPITDPTLPAQTEPLLKRYKSRSGKTFLWNPDLSGGAVAPRAIPCLNETDSEQIQSVSEWIYKNRFIKLDSFLQEYEETKLEPRQFCDNCGECCSSSVPNKPAEAGQAANNDEGDDAVNTSTTGPCKCASASGTGFAYLPDGTLKPKWPHAWEIIECGSGCNCHPDKCANRVVQRGSTHSFLIYKTEKRGWGIRAVTDIAPGRFLVEYCGEVLPNYDCQERERLYDLAKRTYMFGMREPDTGMARPRWYEIDAAQIGNESRWFNHCCEPNCEVYSICIDEKVQTIMGHVAFFTLKEILAGDELTINYRMVASGQEGTYRENQPCFCGAAKCKKSLYDK